MNILLYFFKYLCYNIWRNIERSVIMGRAHEVRAASMAKTAAAKSKLNNKYSRTIYMAAKSGIPDP